MRYLFNAWDELKNRLRGRSLFIFLDYDGTIVPIRKVPDPGKSILPERDRKLLRAIVKSGCSLAIVSGRALRDLKRMAGLKGVIYSGNHGLEVEGPGIRPAGGISLKFMNAVKKLRCEIKEGVAGLKGVFIEDKGLTFSVHYRLAKQGDILEVKRAVRNAAIPYIKKGEVVVSEGKKTIEVKPDVKWDKGRMVLRLLAGRRGKGGPVLPVYIGDDTTDEDAFRALTGKGITVFVGKPKKSLAEYYVKSPSEVRELLVKIARMKR